jgi:hypothetical protein
MKTPTLFASVLIQDQKLRRNQGAGNGFGDPESEAR